MLNKYQRLFLSNPTEYKRVSLSAPQLDIFKYVGRYYECSSRDVALNLGISIQSASARLKTLYEKGYLVRREKASESGGIEFMYGTES